MSNRHKNILNLENTVFVLVDLQTPFLQTVTEKERVLERCLFLAQAAEILNVPVIVSAQYSQRMGSVVSEIASVPSCGTEIDKLSFSCAGSELFIDKTKQTGKNQILIGGVETHICVAQTALDLIHLGYQVHVAADAVSSRGMDRHKLGMEKMRDSGVIPCSAEQAVFELMQKAGTPKFKQILKLVKG